MKKLIDLIKSQSIRKHLTDTNYDFDINAAAWLVDHSELSLEEKDKLFEEIINNYEDCKTTYETCSKNVDSTVHEVLRKLVEKDRIELAAFKDNSDNNCEYLIDICNDGQFAVLFDCNEELDFY